MELSRIITINTGEKLMTCTARIRGLPEYPNITEVNVRSGPNTGQALLFKAAVGLTNLTILEVQPDSAGAAFQGKIYQWFKLNFPNNQSGWVRDDLLEIIGDCGAQGYGAISALTYAFALTRSTEPTLTPPAVTPVVIQPPQETTPPVTTVPPQVGLDSIDRVRKAAFAVTAAFEGHGYAAFQNYDRGIISYGRFQFALTGGLGSLVERYLLRSNSDLAVQLRPYLPRLKAVDESLRNDARLRELLVAAAAEKIMQEVQDEVATENYWNRVTDLSINPRGIQAPLSRAMLFDIGIQYGIMHSLIGMAEDDLAVPRKSVVGENGVTEEKLIAQVAERRRRGLYAQAERDNLPGLKPRADFWVNLISQENWGFVGDSSGNVNVNGKIVQINNV
jgi:hypothetical protein